MTYKEFVTKSINSLSGIYSLREAASISKRVLFHFMKIDEYQYIIESDTTIKKPILKMMQSAMDQLISDRPIQYVLGYEEFAGYRFKVNESVLIPRPETEELCRLIIRQWQSKSYQNLRILDVCTGSGCIAYTLAAAFSNAVVRGVDLSEPALEVARSQKIFVGKEHKIPLENLPDFSQVDVLKDPADEYGQLDILVSNPPYVREQEKLYMDPNVLDFEPGMALFVPDNDPLRFYRALSRWASRLLKIGGMAYFEINEALCDETMELFKSYGFSDVTCIEDIHSKPRIIYFTKWF